MIKVRRPTARRTSCLEIASESRRPTRPSCVRRLSPGDNGDRATTRCSRLAWVARNAVPSSATATGDKKTHQMAQKPVDAKVAAQCAPIVGYGCRQNAGQAEPQASSPGADSSPPRHGRRSRAHARSARIVSLAVRATLRPVAASNLQAISDKGVGALTPSVVFSRNQ